MYTHYLYIYRQAQLELPAPLKLRLHSGQELMVPGVRNGRRQSETMLVRAVSADQMYNSQGRDTGQLGQRAYKHRA